MAGHLVSGFHGRAHLADEVLHEINKGPAGLILTRVNWFRVETLILEEDLALYANLRLRWGSQPGRDCGEAASIVLAKRHSWLFVTDDGTGYYAAGRQGVCVTRTPQLLVSMVRAGWMSKTDGWQALQLMRARGRQFGQLSWTGSDFHSLCSPATFDSW